MRSAVWLCRRGGQGRWRTPNEGAFWGELPKFGGGDGPADVRAHKAVAEFAVDGKLFGVGVGEAVLFGTDEVGGLVELGGAGEGVRRRRLS